MARAQETTPTMPKGSKTRRKRRMNPYRLISPKTNTPTNVWVCSACNRILMDERLANECCKPCQCGKPTRNRFEGKCSDCWDRERHERLHKAMAEAELVEWDGETMLHTDEVEGYHDGWFYSPEELCDYCEDEALEIPEFAFLGRKRVRKLDLDQVIESMLEDTYEDASLPDDKAYKKLAAEVEEFNKRNAIIYYEQSYKRKVRIRDAKPESQESDSTAAHGCD